MTYKIFTDIFRQQVATLSFEKGLHLATTISKELFPDYLHFFERHNWGAPERLTKGISVCERSITEASAIEEIKALAAEVHSVTPDTEDFGDWDGSCALNAAASVWFALTYLVDKDPRHLIALGGNYTDTIDVRLHELGIKGETEINNHPLMQAARQKLLSLSAP
jgi:hypothetical protein